MEAVSVGVPGSSKGSEKKLKLPPATRVQSEIKCFKAKVNACHHDTSMYKQT